ncbi:unnamed protein product, partial [Bubo scandiacus]
YRASVLNSRQGPSYLRTIGLLFIVNLSQMFLDELRPQDENHCTKCIPSPMFLNLPRTQHFPLAFSASVFMKFLSFSL